MTIGYAVVRLPFSVNDPTLEVVPPSELIPPVDYEFDADANWMFTSGSSSLVDAANGHQITPQGSAHQFSDDGVLIPAWGNGFVTDIDDAAIRTTWVIVERPMISGVADGAVLFGTTNSTTDGGSMVAANSALDIPAATFRGTSPTTGLNGSWPTGSIAGDRIFIALSEDLSDTSDPKQAVLYVGGLGGFTFSSTTARGVIARKLSIGNAYFNNANYQTKAVRFLEAGYFSSALTSSQLAGLYSRRKAQWGRLGKPVF